MRASEFHQSIFWVIIAALLSEGAFAQESNPLTGLWRSEQFGLPLVLEFNPNGTGTFDGVPLQYALEPTRLIIRLKGHETIYAYSYTKDRLMLTGGDLDSPLTFARDVQVSDPPLLTMSNGLIGLWSGNGEMIEFRADGKCRYDGNIFTYRLSQGHVVMETPGGNQVFEYVLTMGKLVLITDGERSVFDRVNSMDDQDSKRKPERNPIALVGEWCYLTKTSGKYTDRCITLKEDGTYRYDMQSSAHRIDSGNWFVEGDRLYYQSRLRGSGFYRLERRQHPARAKEPIIVLNDEPFAFVASRPSR